jgi:hypothetical protein
MDIMPVACIRTGERYSIEYVERLQDAVAPHPLICATDRPDHVPGVTNMVLPEGVKGWWGKIWLYSVDLPHPLFVLDLDIIIRAPIEPFLDFDGPMTIRDFYPGCKRADKMNGSVTLIPRAYPKVWENYVARKSEIELTYPSDQEYLGHSNIPWSFYPDEWCGSYRRSDITDKTKIVVFHGLPKPHEVGWSPFRTDQWPPEW